jgi:peptidoglycan-associated lipoprotein
MALMKLKLLSSMAALALLAACESTPEQAGGAGGAGAASTIRPGTQEDLVANVGDRVFFDFDRYDIRPDQRATLERQAAWLQQHSTVQVQIAGHADERGTREYNLALGQRRANTARDFLVARGVAGARISTISYGEDRPIALGSNEEAWAQNRVAITSVR